MKIIKNILGTLYLVYFLLLFIVTMLVVIVPIWIISYMKEPKRSKYLHPVFGAWMGTFMPLAGCPVIRKGKEHFKKGENYVVVTNHNSFVDVPVSSPWIPGPNKTLAKIEMSRTPLFGLIYKTGSILVDRKSAESRRESFTQMQRMLDMGIHLCLYPEGTRNKTGKPMQPFFDGAFITAIKAQKPIMPALIFNTGKILPHNKKFWARPMPVHFHFLPPISTAGLTLKDTVPLKDTVYQIMEQYYTAHLVDGKYKA
jgi:1-acyl-sn-glycerol-3-phosphate acyltransferase